MAVAASLALYFSLSLYYFPQSYLKLPEERSLPSIRNVTISHSEITQGQSFTVDIIGENKGDSADFQIVSIAFPNITSTLDRIVTVKQENFTRTPSINDIGNEIGSSYSATEKTVLVQYPSIEFFSQPWHTGDLYHAQVQVTPATSGKFVIFVKSVALPHNGNWAHYPQEGVKDYQDEFVKVYSVQVQ